MSKRVLPLVLLFSFLSILAPSCAYYNTFYNTKRLYRDALKAREKRQGDKPTSAELQAYEKTIEKASKVLTNYPDSKYVDDAVMIIGECLFYKGDYVKARRKFEELLKLFPKSGYREEARLWLAKSELELSDFTKAETSLREILENSKENDILEEARLLLGDLHFDQGSFEAAVEAYRQAAARGDREKRARAFSQLGEAFLKLNKPEEAIDAFSNARQLTHDRYLQNQARSRTGVAMRLGGHYDDAIRVFTGLLGDATYKDNYPDAKLEIAATLWDQGNLEKAIKWYETITIDHQRTPASAEAHFELGRIYEEEFRDFDSAKKHYDRVRSEYSASEWADEASARSRDIADLLRLRATIAQMETGKRLPETSSDSESPALADSRSPADDIDPELLALRKASLRAQRQRNAVPDSAKGLDDDETLLTRRKELKKTATTAPADSSPPELTEEQKDKLVRSKMQLAELYLLEYSEVDSALKQYLDITEKYPQHPLAPRALYAVAFTLRKFAKDSTRADSVSGVLLSQYPQSPQAKAIAQKSGIPTKDEIGPKELFHKAELALFDRKEPEQAVEMYRKVLELFPESEYAGKALYALAYIHETFLPDSLVALAEYKELAQKHPQSPYARKAAKKIRAVEQAQKMALASGGAGTQASDGTGRANGTASERGSGSESTQDEGRRFRRPSLRDHLEKLRKEGGTERKVP